MRFKNLRFKSRLSIVLGLAIAAMTWSGCGQEGVLSSDITEPNFVPLVQDGGSLGTRGSAGVMSTATHTSPVWFVVAEGLARKNKTSVIQSEQCKLTFFPGAVSKTTQVKIKMYDLNVLEFEFLPDGVPFGTPVRVNVSYAGTNADPDSPNYDGSSPAFFWDNPETGLWEEVLGENNTTTKTYTAFVEHFSRYTLGKKVPGDGTADW